MSADKSSSIHKALSSRPNGVRGEATAVDKQLVKEANIQGIIFPWTRAYKAWWGLTVVGAMVTAFFETYEIAFQKEAGTFNDGAAVLEYILIAIFAVDIMINFDLAYYENEVMIFERKQIAKHYCRRMFWVDFIGIFPFEACVLAAAGELGQDTNKALLLSLVRLLRLVRLHRMKPLQEILQYNPRISFITFTLLRNFAVVAIVAHVEACGMYFLARLRSFGDDTWLGPLVKELNGFERYVVSLYWSVTTFTTVGYGDFSPANAGEQIFGMVAMLFNIIIASWIIGSITLLIVKGDEHTGVYRDSLQVLDQYSHMHNFDQQFQKKLKNQLRLEFNNREIADEQVLKNFPSAVRRKVLRKLYLPSLIKTNLMKGVRQQFVDAFLIACSVEIFSPGEEIVERGSISSDLFLLVGGIAEITTPDPTSDDTVHTREEGDLDSETQASRDRELEAEDFIGEIGFFTESPQVDSVSCLTVCKTLTMSRSTYKLIAEDHPGSVGKILQNLLTKVEEMALELEIPKNLSVLRAGSVFDLESSYGTIDQSASKARNFRLARSRKQEALTAIQDLVKMHMSKQKDDQTTRLLFAASRGDTGTISLMCDQGFDPDNADYDNRTALMVSSMKGSTEVVKLLLEYKADPNLVDVHGSTALYEAVKNGNENTMDLLLKYGAELCTQESLAASILCQAVSDGDILFLKRLLRAGIQVNASDYDKRTAAHIAAAEGNTAALKVLVEHGADLTLEDRWKNTINDEAVRANAGQMLDYIKTLSAE